MGRALLPRRTPHFIFYQESVQYWIKATLGLPYYARDGVAGAPPHGRYLAFADANTAASAFAVLNSSLFYAYFIAYGDCFHLNNWLVEAFPVPANLLEDAHLADIGRTIHSDLTSNAETATITTSDGFQIEYARFFGAKSKPLIDRADALLAEAYRFTDEEFDFIVNYDAKFRLGGED